MTASTTLPAWVKTTEHDPMQGIAPDWLKQFRQAQWDAFIKNGLPTRKDERWKYTDLSFLANQSFSIAKPVDADKLHDIIHQYRLQKGNSYLLVMVNGYFMPSLSDLSKLPKGVTVSSLHDALLVQPAEMQNYWNTQIDAQKTPFASLNAAMGNDGLYIALADYCELTEPVHVLSLVMNQEECFVQPQLLIVMGKSSQMMLTEEHGSSMTQSYFKNVLTTIRLEDDAKLQWVKLQQEGHNAAHVANTFIFQKHNSEVSCVNISVGAQFARDDLIVKLQAAGANCRTSGFYHLRSDNQYIDHHVDIAHLAPHSQSEMLYKGILEKKSRAVFNGRLLVEKDAQKILAYQANHNLLLSNEAEVYSKPELEIYADDVKCKHGATTGQLDQDALFYLRSRGIEKAEAMTLLLAGFSDEIIQRITHAGIKQRVQELLA